MKYNNINEIVVNDSLISFLKKEETWVFDMTREEFQHMIFKCELPIIEAARCGLYKDYRKAVPTKEWLYIFKRTLFYGTDFQCRVLYAAVYNAIWRQSRNHILKDQYKKPASPFLGLVHPYQGYGNCANF